MNSEVHSRARVKASLRLPRLHTIISDRDNFSIITGLHVHFLHTNTSETFNHRSHYCLATVTNHPPNPRAGFPIHLHNISWGVSPFLHELTECRCRENQWKLTRHVPGPWTDPIPSLPRASTCRENSVETRCTTDQRGIVSYRIRRHFLCSVFISGISRTRLHLHQRITHNIPAAADVQAGFFMSRKRS